MLPSETMIWQPEFTDKTLSRKPGAVHNLILLCVFKENTGIFHINLPLFISDHLIKKRFYTCCPHWGHLG
ncbi:hypothetical protein FCV42_17885 [Escherichia coli O157:H7]|nr:hypothetical protein FCV42_17885 [Escherichia coli O157:H7]